MSKFRVGSAVLISILALGLNGCTGSEPSEVQMKDAMEYEMNHPPGVANAEPITIKFFKKEACDKPTPQGYRCTFEVTVASANIGAGMYNNIPFGTFYKDKESGKWTMRPPF
jgi:hypothetical protein